MSDPLEIQYPFKVNDVLLALPRMIFTCEGMSHDPWPGLLKFLEWTTCSKPALWPRKPWFDANGNGEFPFSNENVSHKEWGNQFNQAQLQSYSPEYPILLPAEITAVELDRWHSFYRAGTESFINHIPDIVAVTQWLLYSLTEDHLLFVANADKGELVAGLRKWYQSQWYQSQRPVRELNFYYAPQVA